MLTPYELFVGLRYTRAKRRNHFISFISITSMLGGVLVSGRDPTLEETGTDYAAKHGAYADPVSLGPAGTTPYTVNVYTIELFDTGTAAGTYQVSRGDYYV